MLAFSFKTNRRVVFLISALIFLLILGFILFWFIGNNRGELQQISQYLSTNNQRIEFLNKYGWQVSDEACEIVEVIIPSEFNDVYEKYNDLQKTQKYNLEDYKGKAVKRYTYEVKNYPGQEENVRANLLLYGDRIIGGDICSIELDGFMHGFKKPDNLK